MLVNKEFIKNIESYERLAHGTEGTVYYDGTYLYKLYKVFDQEKFPINRSLFTGLRSDFIAFPIEEYKLSDRITIGYKMPYYEAYNVYYKGLNPNTVISDLERAFKEILEELNRFDDINMFDMESNILFDGKKFYLIDTDRWELNHFNLNLFYLNKCLRDSLIKLIGFTKYSKKYIDDYDFEELSHSIKYDRNATEFLYLLQLLKEFYLLKVGENPNTLDDLNLGGKLYTYCQK